MGNRYRQASPNGDGGTLLTNVSSCTVLSISPMRVPEAWRLGAVWDREVRDGGYGRSSPRKERSWTRTDAALRMSSFYTTLRSACMVLIALRAYRLSEAPHELQTVCI